VGSLGDGLEHVAGLRNVGQVDFGLDLVFGANWAGGTGRGGRRTFLLALEVCPDLLRFVHLEGTGVRLLFANSNGRKYVQNRFALDLKFPGQVIDSNLLLLLHPSFCSSEFRLRVHINLTPLG
jgi:hypothetical protein